MANRMLGAVQRTDASNITRPARYITFSSSTPSLMSLLEGILLAKV